MMNLNDLSYFYLRCRFADLVEVQTNFRLLRHSTMRRAPAMPHSASSLPPSKRHTRLTIVRRGCNMQRNAGVHGEAMYTAPDCAARAVLQAANPQCRGSRGPPLAFSWGSKGAILSRERMAPLFRAAPAALLPLAGCKESIPSCIIPRLW